jgi:hypothetical protein
VNYSQTKDSSVSNQAGSALEDHPTDNERSPACHTEAARNHEALRGAQLIMIARIGDASVIARFQSMIMHCPPGDYDLFDGGGNSQRSRVGHTAALAGHFLRFTYVLVLFP